ncbi:hypothetical protein QJS66_08140 [Kocuria rhizophila]|nr:hypothetical protein QJS66_08140 [Kocuria rhizophila]
MLEHLTRRETMVHALTRAAPCRAVTRRAPSCGTPRSRTPRPPRWSTGWHGWRPCPAPSRRRRATP